MKIPVVHGTIDRRILVNFRVDADVMKLVLPNPFRPKLVGGYAIGGICLIRLKHMRPRFLRLPWGIGSENAAHRIAVEWDEQGTVREGVFVPRRDTNSMLNILAGGTVFPGIHHLADFKVAEDGGTFQVDIKSRDRSTRVFVAGQLGDTQSSGSVFGDITSANQFFQSGSAGYSVTANTSRYDGLELRCKNWSMDWLDVDKVVSSYFEDTDLFPTGSVEFDSAFLMRHIEHEWHGLNDLCCDAVDTRKYSMAMND